MFKRHVKGQNKPQRFTNSICFRVQFLFYIIKNRFGPKYSKTVWEKMMFSQRYLSSKVILIHNILSLVSDCSEIFFSFFQKIGWTMKKTLSTKISLHCTVPDQVEIHLHSDPFIRVGHAFFSKERNVLAFFSKERNILAFFCILYKKNAAFFAFFYVLYKRTLSSLRSFTFFIKEICVLYVLLRSL